MGLQLLSTVAKIKSISDQCLKSVLKVQATLKEGVGVAEWCGGEWCWMRPKTSRTKRPSDPWLPLI